MESHEWGKMFECYIVVQAATAWDPVSLLYHDTSILLIVLSSPPSQVLTYGLHLDEPQGRFQS